MAYIDDIMRAHPNWPRRIRHGEYVGVLLDETSRTAKGVRSMNSCGTKLDKEEKQ